MEALIKPVLLVFLTIFLFYNCSAFNVDTKVPIVKSHNIGSFFGYSVSPHIIAENVQKEIVFLVGAPRDNVTDQRASAKVRSLRQPGAVYKCPLTSRHNDCTYLDLLDDPLDKEFMADMWFGVSLGSEKSEVGYALACAHRFVEGQGDSSRQGLGMCISMTNSLDKNDFVSPCLSQSHDKLHEDFGLCQAGMSVDVGTVDNNGVAFIGAPGSVVWRGSAFLHQIRAYNITVTDSSYFATPAKDPVLPKTAPKPPVQFYSYLGTKSKIANFRGRHMYITGAPRSNETGQVLLFSFNKAERDDEFRTEQYLNGEQFGSWFGGDLDTIDVNGDGNDDLVVSAPFFSDLEEGGVGGAIYVYQGGPQGIDANTKPLRITSRKMNTSECVKLDCHNARFGESVANVGDLDQDGYQDLAVGAPYEGSGVVYIFRGSAQGLQQTPSQVIRAEDLLTAGPLKGFGSSISGGVDMDGNFYPDFVVGAYQSDKAIVLRTRPVISLTPVITHNPLEIDPTVKQCPKDGRPFNCFTVQVCFTFVAKPKERFTSSIRITYRLDGDIRKPISRVFFKARDEASIERTQDVNPKGTCVDPLVYVSDSNRDFYNPVVFRLTYNLSNTAQPVMNQGDPLPDINMYPVINQAAAEVIYDVPFRKNCNSDQKCQSNLKVVADFIELKKDEGEPVIRVGDDKQLLLNIYIQNSGEDAHQADLHITLPPSLSYKGVQDGSRHTCTPFPKENRVECAIDNPMLPNKNTTVGIKLDAERIDASLRSIKVDFYVNTTSIEVDPRDNYYSITAKVYVEADLELIGKSDPREVYYGGEVRGESDMKVEDQVGSEVTHIYQLTNNGPGTVVESMITIDWPYELNIGYDKGMHLLYLMEAPIVSSPYVKCAYDERMINPLRLLVDNSTKVKSPILTQEVTASGNAVTKELIQPSDTKAGRRRKRAVHDGNQGILMCDKGEAKCFQIKCTVGELRNDDSLTISLRARVWNATLVEKFSDKEIVKIVSRAVVTIDPALNVKQLQNNDKAEAVTHAVADVLPPQTAGIPWWVILVAVLGGLLLLLIIVLVLWKCGFFKRDRPDAMYKAKKVKQDKFNELNYE